MDSKILRKWIFVTLMCATLFVALGYAYGSIMANDKCNEYWKMEVQKQCGIPSVHVGLITDNENTGFDVEKVNLTQFNFTPLPIGDIK